MSIRRHPVAVLKSPQAPEVPLDRPLLVRLRESYALVRSQDARLAEVFYAKLFAAAPQLRPLFRSEPAIQAKKLMAALDAVVSNLQNPEANATMLAVLGKRHAHYGARPEHYTLVGDLLVESIATVLGPEASPQALDEWRTALDLISRQMIAAAESDSA